MFVSSITCSTKRLSILFCLHLCVVNYVWIDYRADVNIQAKPSFGISDICLSLMHFMCLAKNYPVPSNCITYRYFCSLLHNFLVFRSISVY
ncbi:hypothetical protein SJAG_06546 [Schizosaccharomyces japonicus yFS275]|uniref:Uncharacterized protein n=1 Tax=Schizosaccharomyces japonicus (strain yFS275 / FY16936) TaxID=402676 RepID=T0RSV0_SCHJY|nr:hypothetical protein SJAG_06546 [Schizosaccharomyces japonicus yFS275]EQC53020.1 hypothetical protein SJAG_06546 [Schizosaccharomyces japonicus yFS275]